MKFTCEQKQCLQVGHCNTLHVDKSRLKRMYALKHIRHSLCHFKANKGVKINTGAIILYVLSL